MFYGLRNIEIGQKTICLGIARTPSRRLDSFHERWLQFTIFSWWFWTQCIFFEPFDCLTEQCNIIYATINLEKPRKSFETTLTLGRVDIFLKLKLSLSISDQRNCSHIWNYPGNQFNLDTFLVNWRLCGKLIGLMWCLQYWA